MRRMQSVAAVLLLVAAACGSGSSPNPDGGNPDGGQPDGGNPDGGTGAITATIDGAAWSSSATYSAHYAAQLLTFGGFDLVRTITVGVNAVSGPGTYSLAYLNPDGSQAAVSNTLGQEWSTFRPGGTGTVTLTTMTAQHAVGTFSFDAPPTGGAMGTVHVTNGRFDVAF